MNRHWNVGRPGIRAALLAGLLMLPATAVSGAEPAVSLDAEAWIAYQTDRGGEGVWLIRPDGSDDQQIAADFAGDLMLPDWSPDGRRLIMTSRETGGAEPLFEYDLETGTYAQVFECEDPCLGDDEPAYSHDSSRVAFIRALGPWTETGPADCGLWIGDFETATVRQITSHSVCDDREYFPRWSPDGTQLTFWRWGWENDATTGMAIFIINVDGTDERQLTEWDTFTGSPDWSPDGEWLVYNTYPEPAAGGLRDGNLYRMRPDGTGVEQLTFNDVSLGDRASQPRYTPDGSAIVYTADSPAGRGLSFLPAGGGDPVVIVDGGIHTHPTLQPRD